MMLAESINDVPLEPLIMLVEDNPETLELETDLFHKRGCKVLGFTHSDDALKAIAYTPSLDLIVTDINLNPKARDKSGISFAKLVRNLNLEIPLCGYSAFFAPNELTNDEKSFFDCWFDKSLDTNEISAMMDDLKTRAFQHRKTRLESATESLASLRDKYKIRTEDYELIREFILNCDSSNHVEDALHRANYKIMILHPLDYTSLSNPILIWVKDQPDFCEAEVYGHPSLYSHGETEAYAICNLIELLQLYAMDSAQDDTSNYVGEALGVKKLLSYAFNQKGF